MKVDFTDKEMIAYKELLIEDSYRYRKSSTKSYDGN